MRRRAAAVTCAWAFASLGCGRLGFDAVASDAMGSDAVAACTWSAWSSPSQIASVSSNRDDWGPSLSGDGLTLYFHSDRTGGTGAFDLYVATRATVTEAFGPPTGLAQLNTTSNDEGIEATSDGLTLYFESDRGGTSRLYRATRASEQASFGSAVLVPELATREVIAPAVSSDGSELFFTDNFGGNRRLLRADIVGGVISTPQPLTELDVATQYEGYPSVSADGLDLYYARGGATADIVHAIRPGRGMPFSPAVPVAELNTAVDDDDPFISRDGTTMLLASDRPTAQGADVFMSTRSCQ